MSLESNDTLNAKAFIEAVEQEPKTEEEMHPDAKDLKEEITKEQKKALFNFRDQVRYKDYKGLIRTLSELECLVKDPGKYFIPDKYLVKFKMTQENILLLKNILISDIKYSISNEKGLDKSVVLLSTPLSEIYLSDIRSSIVTWMSNTTLSLYSKEVQKIEKLSEIDKVLKMLLVIKDQVGIKTAHLPIWWNISKVVLSDLSIILKNKLIRIIDKGEFTNVEYLSALKLCIDFERVYLVSRNKRKNTSSPKEISVLKLSEASPKHLHLLEDISTEKPLCTEELNENSLSLAFIPHIKIYIENELKPISAQKIFFSDRSIHSSTYSIYTSLTHLLSKLAYFNFPSVGHTFLSLTDSMVSAIISSSSFNNAEKNFLSGMETIYYIHETTIQMIQHLQDLFGITHLSSPKTLDALDDLSLRVYSSYSATVYKRILFINTKTAAEESIHSEIHALLSIVLPEVEAISSLLFSRKNEVLSEYVDILGQCLLNVLLSVKIDRQKSEYLLSCLSSLEVPLKNSAYCLTENDTFIYALDRAKIYLKFFLVSPSDPKLFAENYLKLSNGLFHFHQIVTKTPKKYHTQLIEEYNQMAAKTLF
ncbi:hypothetical protein NEFER03_1608 [Nematocida sp. LUAm3]|nr:hypothetical protein NEFER03_1608 [Nematocida sp. LUAm3]